MKLLSLEIEGFKSFAKRTVFNLDKNIIAIVGPNGSGKSNIVDAIRWLLGEQSQKQIRISEKSDILFIGNNGHDSSNQAKVSLVLEDKEKKLVKISKVLEKDSSNKYFVNNKLVTLKDLQNVFDNGLGKNFYSIIGQGQIGEIVNSSAENIRDIVLDASNISRYLEKKKNSLILLEKSQENLERVNDLLFVIDKRLKSLAIRAGRAKKYLEYVNEIQRIGKVYFGSSKISLIKEIKEREIQLNDNEQKIKELLTKLFEVERNYRSLKDEMENVDEELTKNGDLVESYRKRLQNIEDEKEKLTEELNNYNSKLMNKNWQNTSLKENISSLEKKLKETASQEEEFKKLKEKKEKEFSLKEETKKKLISNIELLEKKMRTFQSDLNTLTLNIKSLQEKINEYDKKTLNNQNKINLLKEQKTTLENRKKKNLEKLQEIENELMHTKDAQAKFETLSKKETDELKNIEEKYKNLSKELDNLIQEEKSLHYSYESLQKQINEYEGFSGITKDFFKTFKDDPNVVDVVANLIETDEKYEEAVSTIAGSRLQNIVIKDSNQAKKYLNHLKQNNSGKITFLPLDLLKTNLILKEKYLNEPGTIGFLINLINFDDKYKKVMEYVFSNALLVDNIETAINLSKMNYNGNIVTLSGELVSSYGAITGGKSKYDYSSTLLKRKRELTETEKRLLAVKSELKNKISIFESLKAEISNKKEKLEKLKDDLRDIFAKKSIHDSNFKNIKEDILDITNQLEQIEEKLVNFEEENKQQLQQINVMNNELAKSQEEYSKIQEEFKKTTEEVAKGKRTLEDLEKELLSDSMELKSLKEKYDFYQSQKINLSKELETLKEQIEQSTTESIRIEEEVKKIRATLLQIEQEKTFLNDEITKLFDIMKKSRSGKYNKSQDLEKYENERNKLKEMVNELRSKNQKIEFEIKETEHKIEFLKEKARNLDINENEFELKELLESDIKALENRIKDLEESLRKLGSVDLTVLNEYEEVEKEYEENRKNKEDILNSINSLKNSILKLDEEAETQYSKFFEELNKEFGHFISKLFSNGFGELKQIGEGKSFEKGIQISVKKAGRNFQKLSLFSGGEKALIAIAFLFALMNLNPSPFYILDEIDAPLDDINASKIADLIVENAQKSQFLIITHNKLVMEIAEVFYGITMRDGITFVVPVDFKELER
ncbi:chromosome segregation protein SMC [Petrotoga sp. 9PWA.NaAc.5.4]|uniref:chromosome segregation protein SMC n=1 Tax=Petrotoga sp. 9PWA.NaAc.5.4 TaxID=1434328 RepID=UPI000CB0BDAF|nr:chromosome segregation protein SMC [Petrotoga sp. 9PWA.NaAc.5.4]PNR95379.1 hypothetical protein X924_04525 [Petrotoga sp. 9PWA.NaAc.5.4]